MTQNVMATHLHQTASETTRLRWVSFETSHQDDGIDVKVQLSQTPKGLPCRYFYDDVGSQLFEQITELPEYYPTRVEQSILEQESDAIAHLTGPCDLIELGSGSSRKTRLLLDAYSHIDAHLLYCPIDVSAGILKDTALTLLQHYSSLSLLGLAGTYEQALTQLPLQSSKPRLLLFLGSTLGNLSVKTQDGLSQQHRFLQLIQSALRPGDYFLLGVDLQKPTDILEAAYNDSQGITAAFNLNILTHLNRRFQGNFDIGGYRHVAFYNQAQHQIEMHLESAQAQTQQVLLQDLNLRVEIQPQERIRTEISRKFNLEMLGDNLKRFDLMPIQTFTDSKDWFALLLCQYSG